MKRTHFLLGAASGLALVAGVDSLFSKALMKPMLPGLAGGVDNRVFVIVNLKGGNDGLNTDRSARHARLLPLAPLTGHSTQRSADD